MNYKINPNSTVSKVYADVNKNMPNWYWDYGNFEPDWG